MAGHSPAGPLMKEHRIIERMISVLTSEMESIESHQHTDPVLMTTAVDFIRTYADRCHHGKEEDILFRRLAEKGLDPQLAKEMQELIDDHVYARDVTGQLIDANSRYAAGSLTALDEVESSLRTLIEFYPAHIAKEEKHFFKPCMAYFSDSEQAQMLADFDEFDRTLIHDKYRLIVEGLEQAAK